MTETLACLNEDELDIFVEAALEFFRISCKESAEAGDASIAIVDLPSLDYTGLINVSGVEQGFAYLTASRSAMRRLMMAIAGETGNDELYKDLIGEIVSIIVSNTRRHFGARLKVSVPKVYTRTVELEHGDTMGFILPLKFQGEELILVLALYPSVSDS